MNQVELTNLFQRFKELSVLVIGDVMLDRYIYGKVDRISPEAPVPVVNVTGYDDRLGGAANVALNILAMEAKVTLCGVIGHDQTGEAFISKMTENNLTTIGIMRVKRPTTTKLRIIGNKSQLLRVDEEDNSPLGDNDAQQLIKHVCSLIDRENFDVIVFEDYDKGLISPSLIQSVVEAAAQKDIPIAVDPKFRNFGSYKGVSLFKPNLKELREGLNTEADPRQQVSIIKAEQQLRRLLNHKISLITLSEYGVFAAAEHESYFLPAHIRNIADVSGAGDTVISIAALCLGAKSELSTLLFLSNLAGGLVCEKPGVVPVDPIQLFEEANRILA